MTKRSEDEIIFYKNHSGHTFSVYPPQTFLTFDYWIYMVPQYKPENVLILGYGGGTIAGLIKMIWGELPITGVDLVSYEDHYGVNFIEADARDFLKTCPKFDTVIVDLICNDNSDPCEFLTDPDFIHGLEKISNYLIVNGYHTDMSAFNHLRKIGQNKPSGTADVVYYYQIADEIPNLRPSK